METLARRPQSVDEIGAAKREWTSIYGSKDEVKAKFKKLEELSRMMRQHGARGAHPSTELAALTSRWEELELTLDAFNERIEDQMAHLRGQVRVRVRSGLGSTLTLTLSLSLSLSLTLTLTLTRPGGRGLPHRVARLLSPAQPGHVPEP